MSIFEAYESGEHESKVSHFAAIVKLAIIDGPINPEEETVLKRLAVKLDVSEEEVKAARNGSPAQNRRGSTCSTTDHYVLWRCTL